MTVIEPNFESVVLALITEEMGFDLGGVSSEEEFDPYFFRFIDSDDGFLINQHEIGFQVHSYSVLEGLQMSNENKQLHLSESLLNNQGKQKDVELDLFTFVAYDHSASIPGAASDNFILFLKNCLFSFTL